MSNPFRPGTDEPTALEALNLSALGESEAFALPPPEVAGPTAQPGAAARLGLAQPGGAFPGFGVPVDPTASLLPTSRDALEAARRAALPRGTIIPTDGQPRPQTEATDGSFGHAAARAFGLREGTPTGRTPGPGAGFGPPPDPSSSLPVTALRRPAPEFRSPALDPSGSVAPIARAARGVVSLRPPAAEEALEDLDLDATALMPSPVGGGRRPAVGVAPVRPGPNEERSRLNTEPTRVMSSLNQSDRLNTEPRGGDEAGVLSEGGSDATLIDPRLAARLRDGARPLWSLSEEPRPVDPPGDSGILVGGARTAGPVTSPASPAELSPAALSPAVLAPAEASPDGAVSEEPGATTPVVVEDEHRSAWWLVGGAVLLVAVGLLLGLGLASMMAPDYSDAEDEPTATPD